MAKRPIFVPGLPGGPLVREVWAEFPWHPGFSAAQKRRNVAALHAAAAELGLPRVLEVSTKSEDPLGSALSAFNLPVLLDEGRTVPLEGVFQGSKVFEHAGPFTDLYDAHPRDAKRDPRLRESGPLTAFSFDGRTFPLEPRTAFYDWLYLRALLRDPTHIEGLRTFDGFTDIEFNPEKSINGQARTCATAVALAARDELDACAASFEHFAGVLRSQPALS